MLAILVVVYTMNFVDRQILAILAKPIKAELHLSDGQFGLMGGLAFALLYSTIGVPIACVRRPWLAAHDHDVGARAVERVHGVVRFHA